MSDSDMSDFSHCSSGSSDEEASLARNAIADISYELKPLNFTCYDTCGDKKDLYLRIPISEFKLSKVLMRKNEINPNNVDILYDGHKFSLNFKAFSGLVKRSPVFERERYVKIKDVCLSKMFWEDCHTITTRLEEEYQKQKLEMFCCYIEWYKIFINFIDERLARRRMHYFEDVCVALDRICLIGDKAWTRQYRLVCEMISAKSMLSNTNKFEPLGLEKEVLLIKNGN